MIGTMLLPSASLNALSRNNVKEFRSNKQIIQTIYVRTNILLLHLETCWKFLGSFSLVSCIHISLFFAFPGALCVIGWLHCHSNQPRLPSDERNLDLGETWGTLMHFVKAKVKRKSSNHHISYIQLFHNFIPFNKHLMVLDHVMVPFPGPSTLSRYTGRSWTRCPRLSHTISGELRTAFCWNSIKLCRPIVGQCLPTEFW